VVLSDEVDGGLEVTGCELCPAQRHRRLFLAIAALTTA
jgi:hypothetical protein